MRTYGNSLNDYSATKPKYSPCHKAGPKAQWRLVKLSTLVRR